MKFNKTLIWSSSLLVLGACRNDPPEQTPQLSEVSVTCTPSSVTAGQSTQCTASATDQNGEPFAVSNYTWTSSDEALAKVDGQGSVTSLAAGTTRIRASATVGAKTAQGEASVSINQRMPTVHERAITSAETWRASDNPHVVKGQLAVDGDATLTLEPGVDVRFAPEAELRVKRGALVATGTPQAPIVLAADNAAAPGSWRGVVFAAEGSASRLEHVSVRDCGQASGEGACLTLIKKAAPILRDVSVMRSGGMGVDVADDGSAFGATSTRLSIEGSAGYALRLGANQGHTLPADSQYRNNQPNAVELVGDVWQTQAWINPGVPLDVNGTLRIAGLENAEDAILTLAKGTVLRFGPSGELFVGLFGPGELIAEGAVDAPITLTSNQDNPQAGAWHGVYLFGGNKQTTRLSHTVIRFAGASSATDPRFSTEASVYIEGSPVLDTVEVRDGRGIGIYVGNASEFGKGSRQLTLRDNSGPAVQVNANWAQSVPASITATGNGTNGVVVSGHVFYSQTWAKLNIPYVVSGSLIVGYFAEAPAVLTLAEGTELRFNRDAEVLVGALENWPHAALVAEGTAAAPIRFVPNEDVPTSGYWRGLHFFRGTGSKLRHVRVTHAGAPGQQYKGNLNVYQEVGLSVRDSVFASSAVCAIYTRIRGDNPVTTDFTLPEYNNVLQDNRLDQVCN